MHEAALDHTTFIHGYAWSVALWYTVFINYVLAQDYRATYIYITFWIVLKNVVIVLLKWFGWDSVYFEYNPLEDVVQILLAIGAVLVAVVFCYAFDVPRVVRYPRKAEKELYDLLDASEKPYQKLPLHNVDNLVSESALDRIARLNWKYTVEIYGVAYFGLIFIAMDSSYQCQDEDYNECQAWRLGVITLLLGESILWLMMTLGNWASEVERKIYWEKQGLKGYLRAYFSVYLILLAVTLPIIFMKESSIDLLLALTTFCLFMVLMLYLAFTTCVEGLKKEIKGR